MARVAWRRLLSEQFRGLTDHKSGSSYGEFGNDTISGGAGWDYPIFSHLDFGESDVVTDFEVGVDKLVVQDTEPDDWNDLNDANDGDYMEQVGDDVVIHTSDLDTVTLQNTQMGDLIQADFMI